MNSDIIALFDYYEKEKEISRDVVADALKRALLKAAEKAIGPARELDVTVNNKTGDIKATAKLIVVEEVANGWEQIAITQAQRLKADAEIGEEIEVPVTPKNFGRIAAQTAKQTMNQFLRQAEKARIYEEFKDRAGDIVSGTIRRFEKSDVYVDLGRFEGVMPSKERVSTEDYNVGDRIRCYVVAVENEARGPEIILSRSHPNFVRRLFESEVSEIADHTVEIRSIAREAGYRTKVAVHSADEKVDPVGACVGLRGARVKNIVRELNNEKVDIIRWSDNPDEFVRDALKPTTIRSVEVFPGERRIRVTVPDEELSKAIGRRGQNARLTNRLMGWDVQIEKDESESERVERRVVDAAEAIAGPLGIATEQGINLVRGGFMTLDLIAMVDPGDIVGALEGIDGAAMSEEDAAALIRKAKVATGELEAEPEAPAAEAEPAPAVADATIEEPETTNEPPADTEADQTEATAAAE
ncbi:MAG: transcription termination factor NusA [Verrucomicrobiales bacterium]